MFDVGVLGGVVAADSDGAGVVRIVAVTVVEAEEEGGSVSERFWVLLLLSLLFLLISSCS